MIKLNLNSKYSTVKFVYLIQTQDTRIYSLRIILPTSYPDSFHWRKKSSIPHHYVSEMSLGTRLSFSARLDVTAGEFTYLSYKCVQETGNPVYAFSKHLVYLHNEYNLINIIKNRIQSNTFQSAWKNILFTGYCNKFVFLSNNPIFHEQNQKLYLSGRCTSQLMVILQISNLFPVV